MVKNVTFHNYTFTNCTSIQTSTMCILFLIVFKKVLAQVHMLRSRNTHKEKIIQKVYLLISKVLNRIFGMLLSIIEKNIHVIQLQAKGQKVSKTCKINQCGVKSAHNWMTLKCS